MANKDLLLEGQQYALRSQFSNAKGQSMVFVKLTDSALKAIEDYAAALKKGNVSPSFPKPSIEFRPNNSTGVISIPTKGGNSAQSGEKQSYNFSVKDVQNDGIQEAVQQNRREMSMDSLGKIMLRMQIHANDDSYQNTRVKMAQAEQEAKKYNTKVIGSGDPSVGRKVKVKRPGGVSGGNSSSKLQPFSGNGGVSANGSSSSSSMYKKSPSMPSTLSSMPRFGSKFASSSSSAAPSSNSTSSLSLPFQSKTQSPPAPVLSSSESPKRALQEQLSSSDSNNLKTLNGSLKKFKGANSDNSNSRGLLALPTTATHSSSLKVPPTNSQLSGTSAINNNSNNSNHTSPMDKQGSSHFALSDHDQSPNEGVGGNRGLYSLANNGAISSNNCYSKAAAASSNFVGRKKSNGLDMPMMMGESHHAGSNGHHHQNGGRDSGQQLYSSRSVSNGNSYNNNNHHNHHQTTNRITPSGNGSGSINSTPNSSPDSGIIQVNGRSGHPNHKESGSDSSGAGHSGDKHGRHAGDDYLSKYTKIQSPEQLAEYREHFYRDYPEYRRLFEYVDTISRQFEELKELVFSKDEESEEWHEYVRMTLVKYDEVKHDPRFPRAQKRLQHLHYKLMHIKNLISEYHQRHGIPGTGLGPGSSEMMSRLGSSAAALKSS